MAPIEINLPMSFGLAAAAWLLGALCLRLVPRLGAWSLPTAIVGGTLVALILLALRLGGGLEFHFDSSLNLHLMTLYLGAIGFEASLARLRQGGRLVWIFLALCVLMMLGQNLLGGLIAWAAGQPFLLGTLTGSAALTGGPATALAFSSEFSAKGITDAATWGLAGALGGILLGGLLGGPLGTWLLRLLPPRPADAPVAATAAAEASAEGFDSRQLLRHGLWLIAALLPGLLLHRLALHLGWNLPEFLPVMLVTCALRQIDEKWRCFDFHPAIFDGLSRLCLNLFLCLALITLDWNSLAQVSFLLPLILLAQAAFVLLCARFLIFRFCGRDYEAAVMAAGMTGFMLGTTANAMGNMQSLTRRYGPAPQACLIVPIVAACFVSFCNAWVIVLFLKLCP
ncbi:MAG: hypothetical protein RL095_355 [Verrucomicrobiota bacterium]|jgi:ESS family glutamate:Na+ symporter